jgi:hypothetical protein
MKKSFKILILVFINLIVATAASLPVIGCRQSIFEKDSGFTLQPGDLLFQDLDCGPLCDAIEIVTTGFQGARFSHVGIVAKNDNGGLVVIEALSDGVEATPLQAFLDRSFDAEGRPKVVAGRLKPPFRHLIPAAIKEAFALKGKPYDKLFFIGNDSYYCSELIYEIFLRAGDSKPLFILQPMTFKAPDTGSIFPAWQEYFSNLGAAVPEGRPGINPGAISCSQVLTIIHIYGIPDGWQKREPNNR